MKYLDCIVAVLLIIGGLNWGLMGLAEFNIVTNLFGATVITKVVYLAIGAAAVYRAINWKSWCKFAS